MSKNDFQKEAIKHFRLSIIDAKLAYVLFKSLYLSRAESIVGKDLFEKYFWVQKQHNYFFGIVEHCAVNTFVIKILHGFDGDNRSLTLKDIDNDSYEIFVKNNENKIFLESVKNLRNKNIAHFNKDQKHEKNFPSFEKIDLFFKNLEEFYNGLVGRIEDSVTLFGQDEDLKYDLEKVLQNLYVGEKTRLMNVDIKYMWDENSKKISKSEI